jgi:uncharacterized protein YbjT (DUF2867 family)
MYVVAGVTGNTGSVAAETLLATGQPVTVIVRSEQKGETWKTKGAKVAVSTLGDTARMTEILTGADGAYLLAKAVSQSKIAHVVLKSSAGGHLRSGTGLILVNHMAEEAFKPTTQNLTILRPGSFAENWATVLGLAKGGGVLPTFHSTQHKLTMIATADVGRFAAGALLEPARGLRILDLAGPEEYNPDDLARILSALLHREVRAVNPPISAAVPTFMKMGFSEDAAKLFEEMFVAANSGALVFEKTGTEFRRGTITPRAVFHKLLQQ